MYDFYLGGKDNFAADREAALQALTIAPGLPLLVREARRFLGHAVRFLAESGIRQFVDIGTGLPTQGNVHEVAQAVAPDARIVYVDNDPVVRVHAEALLEHTESATVLQADMRDPEQILHHPDLLRLIDLDQPVAILLFAVLYTVPEDDQAEWIVARLREAMAPGSYLAISHPVSDRNPEMTAQLAMMYQQEVKVIRGVPRSNIRAKAEVARYFDGLELIEPGVAFLHEWWPSSQIGTDRDQSIWAVGGIGQKK